MVPSWIAILELMWGISMKKKQSSLVLSIIVATIACYMGFKVILFLIIKNMDAAATQHLDFMSFMTVDIVVTFIVIMAIAIIAWLVKNTHPKP